MASRFGKFHAITALNKIFRCSSKAFPSDASPNIAPCLKRRGQKVYTTRKAALFLFFNRHDRPSY